MMFVLNGQQVQAADGQEPSSNLPGPTSPFWNTGAGRDLSRVGGMISGVPRTLADFYMRHYGRPFSQNAGAAGRYFTQPVGEDGTPLQSVAANPDASPGVWDRPEPFDNPGGSPRMPPQNPALSAIREGAGEARATSGGYTMGGGLGGDGEDAPPMPGGGTMFDGINQALLSAGEAIQAADKDPSVIQQLIAQMQNPQVSETDKWLAVARGGAGMASSRQPTFLGAFGDGTGVGIDAYQKQQREAGTNAARAAQAHLEDARRRESERHNRSTEAYRTEDIRSRGEDRKDRAEIERARLAETKRYHDATTGRGDWVVVGQTKDGKPLYQNRHTNEESVGKFEVSSLGRSAGSNVHDKKVALYRAAGMNDQEIADRISGTKPTSRAEAERIATAHAKAATANLVGNRASEEYNRIRRESLGELGFGGEAGPSAPAANGGGRIVAKTQADIDNAPSGSIVVVNGKEFRKP